MRVRSWRYRKLVKSVFYRLTAVLHRQRVISGLIDRIVDHVSPVFSRHDIHVFQVAAITQRTVMYVKAVKCICGRFDTSGAIVGHFTTPRSTRKRTRFAHVD